MKVFLTLLGVNLFIGSHAQFINNNGFNWIPNQFVSSTTITLGRRPIRGQQGFRGTGGSATVTLGRPVRGPPQQGFATINVGRPLRGPSPPQAFVNAGGAKNQGRPNKGRPNTAGFVPLGYPTQGRPNKGRPNAGPPNAVRPSRGSQKGGRRTANFNKQYQYNPAWSLLKHQFRELFKPQLQYQQSAKYAGPRKPRPQHYQDFYGIYNRLDNDAYMAEDINTTVDNEMDETNDDFDGRSIVAPGQYPHMAAIGFPTTENNIEFKCGGSLISDTFVLTAAHCCWLNGDTPVIVKLGIINLKDDNADNFTPQESQILEIIIHPLYNTTMHYHDIALLRLQESIHYTRFVRPLRLWARDDIPYDNVFTMGYGSTRFAKAPTNILTEMDLTPVSQDECNRMLQPNEGTPHGVTDTQICAKDYVKNRDTCQGDSGGPLQLNLERRRRPGFKFYLVGIISYGEVCGGGSPGVYTKVSSYVDWIASIVWPQDFQYF